MCSRLQNFTYIQEHSYILKLDNLTLKIRAQRAKISTPTPIYKDRCTIASKVDIFIQASKPGIKYRRAAPMTTEQIKILTKNKRVLFGTE